MEERKAAVREFLAQASERGGVEKLAADMFADALSADMDLELVAERCRTIGVIVDGIRTAAEEPVLKISQDPDCMSPREWDNLGTMTCWHGSYDLGDVQGRGDPGDWHGHEEPGSVVLPLYLYDHSGLVMSTTPFSCHFDSGQVGWIVATEEDIKLAFEVDTVNDGLRDRVRDGLGAEVRVYSQWLEGLAWGYEHGDDSCWGLIGETLEDTGLLDALDHLDADMVKEAWERRFGDDDGE